MIVYALYSFLLRILSNRYLFIATYFCVSLVSFKGEVGCDDFGYTSRFLNFSPENFDIIELRGELLWWLIEYITFIFNLPYYFYYIIGGHVAFVFLYLALRGSNLYTLRVIFPLIIIQLGLSGIRQFISVAILMYFWVSIRDRGLSSKSFFILFLAAGFHISALIGALGLLLFTKVNVKQALLIGTLIMIGLSSEVLNSATEVYSNRYFAEGASQSTGAIVRWLLTVSMVFVATGFNRIEMKKHRRIILGVLMLGVLVFFSTVALHRINYYLYAAVALYWGSSDHKFNRSAFMTLPYIYLGLWFLFASHSFCINNYSTSW